MKRCIDWYMPDGNLRLADLGSISVNGSYRSLFGDQVEYIGLDLEPGPGVDIVQSDPYHLPLSAASCDVVISGQMLEHCGQFWRVFTEIERVLKPSGLAFMIAPSGGPVHRYPVDCYRFYPDSYEACAAWSGLRLVDVWHDDRGPWRDMVGVFQKGGDLAARREPRPPAPFRPFVRGASIDEEERTAGARPYLEVLGDLHALLRPRRYVEIGVRKGASLALARCPSLAVDPAPELAADFDLATVDLRRCTSDDFFHFNRPDQLERADLAFIDGMHLCEFVLRDFINVERMMAETGVVLIDDVFPTHPAQAARDRRTQVWTGDVWRFAELVEARRPDLRLTFLDAAPTGLLAITGLDPRSTRLLDEYNPLMRELDAGRDREPPEDVLRRRRAVPPTPDALAALLGR